DRRAGTHGLSRRRTHRVVAPLAPPVALRDPRAGVRVLRGGGPAGAAPVVGVERAGRARPDVPARRGGRRAPLSRAQLDADRGGGRKPRRLPPRGGRPPLRPRVGRSGGRPVTGCRAPPMAISDGDVLLSEPHDL